MNYDVWGNKKDFTLGHWIGYINKIIEDETTLNGNEMRDLLDFLILSTIQEPKAEQEPCEDCISRRDVIELISDIQDTVFGQTVTKGVEKLPSVQPKTEQEPNHGWHPSSDAPESRGMFLVTRHYGKGDEIEIAHYTEDMRVVDEYDYADTRRGGWYRYDPEYGNYEIDNVVAWMPLPEPYKESEVRMTREEAIKELRELRKIGEIMTNAHYEAVDTAIKALEQEPKTGHWIKWKVGYGCSECTLATNDYGKNMYRYCPNCGAKMESEG